MNEPDPHHIILLHTYFFAIRGGGEFYNEKKTEKMTTKEKQLASKMLKLADEHFSNHGCNDVEESMFEGWELWERQDFVRRYHEWNGDPENYDPNFMHLPDFAIMGFLAERILQPL